MTPDLTILQGDCREKLRELPDRSVHCCVTSPPFYGLRDYNTPAQVWGGDPECAHEWDRVVTPAANGICHDGGMSGETLSGNSATRKPRQSDFCQKCDAWRGSLGLEPTLELFVRNIVLVFREVRRALRDDATLWLNLGDSYAGSWGNYGGKNRSAGTQRIIRNGSQCHQRAYDGLDGWRPPTSGKLGPGLKPKDLIGIPWMVAFALRADGWYLRQDIIWSKPNPMPESVTDRCTKSHEYMFLLSKSERYYYDSEAVAEQALRPEGIGHFGGAKGRAHVTPETDPNFRNGHEQWGRLHINGTTRNKRSVWTVPTSPFPDAHFATYPPALIQPCILAGCPAGGVVLDPFAGSGTTGKVALELGRSAILIELNPEYVKLIEKRCRVNLPLMFEQGAA